MYRILVWGLGLHDKIKLEYIDYIVVRSEEYFMEICDQAVKIGFQQDRIIQGKFFVCRILILINMLICYVRRFQLLLIIVGEEQLTMHLV